MFECYNGKLYVIDLERPEQKSEVLIEATGGDPKQIQWFWVHWVDASKPRLSVPMALWYRLSGMTTKSFTLSFSNHALAIGMWEQHQVPIHIYNVEIVGHGLGAKVRAKHLISVRNPSLGRHMIATLDGEHFSGIWRDPISQITVIRYCEDNQPIQAEPMSVEIEQPIAVILQLW